VARQSLYRKYRPQTFDEVVGQPHVVRTLRNAVSESVVAHAYLFTGPRGTGKTTTARLLAKALNCASGPTAEPHDDCEACREIAEGRHPDVHELDAASRTGVDAVREEIITKVNFAPTSGKYKIYIIDEVHMLSTSAFNALLKTLEEPPPHTVFMLCTTHPHKVPETILSRCQRFDFHRIGVEDIVGQLERIAAKEGFDSDPGVMTLIARYAEGGLRDAISTLEQLSVYTGGRIGIEDVEGLLGEVDDDLLFEVTDLVADRDIAGAFRFLARRADMGTDMAEFARGLVRHFRDLFVVSSAGDGIGLVDLDEEHLGRLYTQARRFGQDRLARSLDLLSELLVEIRWSTDSRLALEITLTRMASPKGELTLEALAERIEALEDGGVARPSPVPDVVEAKASSKTPAEEPARLTDVEESLGETESVSGVPEDGLDRAAVKRTWPAVLAEVKKSKSSSAHLFLSTEIDVDGATLIVEFPSDQRVMMGMATQPEIRGLLDGAIATVFGAPVEFRYQLGRGTVRPPEPDVDQEADTTQASIEEVLMRDLGAELVSERVTEPGEGGTDEA